MAYRKALEAAGAKVHTFKRFGSYQGDWWAKLTYNQKTGWVHGVYGSCSVCDAFNAEFGYQRHDCIDEEYYDPIFDLPGFRDGCAICQSIKERFTRFGEHYLENIMSQEEAFAKANENIDWDWNAQEMIDFIKDNPV